MLAYCPSGSVAVCLGEVVADVHYSQLYTSLDTCLPDIFRLA